METIANSFSYGGSRTPGAKRERVMGYLRAANELRQTYQKEWQSKGQDEDMEVMPGGYPDVNVVQSGDEEMLLFPSYARKHARNVSLKQQQQQQQQQQQAQNVLPGTGSEIEHQYHSGDSSYWMAEWERFEDANAVVDVDVRGWIYSPQKGPLNRKNRLLVAVARRLSGVPAPESQNTVPTEPTTHSERVELRAQQREELAAKKEAENIAKHGEQIADAAARGSYSGSAMRTVRGLEPGSAPGSRSTSPGSAIPADARSLTDVEDVSDSEEIIHRSLAKRESWNEPANMSRGQLLAANEMLMTRLKPFMNLAMANTDITIFFFNDNKSQSKIVRTNESGHFNVRAALNFIPTHVRVLASETLSATEAVHITDSHGISLISDIDDTIKHSAISAGAREIFKNTFIRELGDLTIDGVKEWYGKMQDLGVKIHYVSNSPWQLYPVLKSYFLLAGLPHGSFHLKRYTGMLQGIFEPAAERKKGSIDRILHDFPDRRFILVGDSGEADLEVYTEAVMNYPDRILGVFIRDVTTPHKKNFFDPTFSNRAPDPGISAASSDSYKWQSDKPADRPALPARQKSESAVEAFKNTGQGDLIDLNDDTEVTSEIKSSSFADDLKQLQAEDAAKGSKAARAPPPPSKPSNLRGFATKVSSPPASPTINVTDTLDETPTESTLPTKRIPPPPPRPRLPQRPSSAVDLHQAVTTNNAITQGFPRPPTRQRSGTNPAALDSRTDLSPTSTPFPGARMAGPNRTASSNTLNGTESYQSSQNGGPSEETGYIAGARRQIMTAYNALPSMRPAAAARDAFANANSAPGVQDRSRNPAPPSRRNYTGTAAAASRWITGASGGDPAAGGGGGAAPGAPYNKKEEMWKRRWTQSEEIMKRNGVVLKMWRVGGDVMDESARLVERAMRDSEGMGRRGGVSTD